jgi:type II secretory pathway predicted ATPase ExeA
MAIDYLKYWNIEKPVFVGRTGAEGMLLSEVQEDRLKPIINQLHKKNAAIIITGEKYSGKTFFAQWLYKKLPYEKFECIYELSTDIYKENKTLGDYLIGIIGGKNSNHLASPDKFNYLSTKINQQFSKDKRKLIFFIDDASNMSIENFEEIDLLLNSKMINENSLSFILIGHELTRHIEEKNQKLMERVPLIYTQSAYEEESETILHIQKMLENSSIKTRIFDQETMKAIHLSTKGNLKLINQQSESLLAEAANIESGNFNATATSSKRKISDFFQ